MKQVHQKSDICHYWYFLNYSFKFQPNVCNRCHDLLIMSMNLSNIAILNIKGFDYRYIISLISKNEAINARCWFDRKKRNVIKHKNLLSHIKMGENILTFGDTEIEKNGFHRNKTPIPLRDIYWKRLTRFLLVKKNYKYCIGYLYNDNKFKSLHIMLCKTRTM